MLKDWPTDIFIIEELFSKSDKDSIVKISSIYFKLYSLSIYETISIIY